MRTRNVESSVVSPIDLLGRGAADGADQAPVIGERLTIDHELINSISRLAVLHDDPLAQRGDNIEERPNLSKYRGQIVQRGHDESIPDWFEHNEDSLAKTHALRAIRRAMSVGALRTIRPRQQDGESFGTWIDWGDVARQLVVAAAQEQEEGRRGDNLVAGVIASQFAARDADRQDFVLSVYDHGLQAEAAQACAGSPLHIVVSTPGMRWDAWAGQFEPASDGGNHYVVQSVSHFATVFTLEPDHLRGYIERMPKGAGTEHADGTRSPKRLRKDLMAQEPGSAADQDTRDEAMVVSVDGEKVGGVVLDPYKIERFALQARFIRKQFAALFGESVDDVVDSRFAELLRGTYKTKDDTLWIAEIMELLEMRSGGSGLPRTLTENIETAMTAFRIDVSKAFRRGSVPVIDEFKLEDGTAREDMSPEQVAEWRYGVVRDIMLRQDILAQYVNYDEFVRRRVQSRTGASAGEHVWSLSEEGAAVPAASVDMLNAVMQQACAQASTLRATPEELLGLLQQNRRALLALATHALEELADALGQAGDEPLTTVKLHRDDSGVLQMDARMTMPAKGSMDLYAAQLLGCPALPEVHPTRLSGDLTAEQRLAHGSSNYIDHALAAVFNEAYARGLLNTAAYLPKSA